MSMRRFDVNTPPIDGEQMVSVAGVVRLVSGLAFVAYSVVSTINILGAFLWPLLQQSYGPIVLSYAVALAFAIIVTLAEWGTRGGINWLIVLTLDAPFTAYQTFAWLGVIVDYHYKNQDNTVLVFVAKVIFSALWGIAIAKFGEVLLVRKKKMNVGKYPISSTGRAESTRRPTDVRPSLSDYDGDFMEAIYRDAEGQSATRDGRQQRKDKRR